MDVLQDHLILDCERTEGQAARLVARLVRTDHHVLPVSTVARVATRQQIVGLKREGPVQLGPL